MPHGENLDFDHQSAASRARWSRTTPRDRAKQLRAMAAGLVARAEELELSAEQNLDEKDTTPLPGVAE